MSLENQEVILASALPRKNLGQQSVYGMALGAFGIFIAVMVSAFGLKFGSGMVSLMPVILLGLASTVLGAVVVAFGRIANSKHQNNWILTNIRLVDASAAVEEGRPGIVTREISQDLPDYFGIVEGVYKGINFDDIFKSIGECRINGAKSLCNDLLKKFIMPNERILWVGSQAASRSIPMLFGMVFLALILTPMVLSYIYSGLGRGMDCSAKGVCAQYFAMFVTMTALLAASATMILLKVRILMNPDILVLTDRRAVMISRRIGMTVLNTYTPITHIPLADMHYSTQYSALTLIGKGRIFLENFRKRDINSLVDIMKKIGVREGLL